MLLQSIFKEYDFHHRKKLNVSFYYESMFYFELILPSDRGNLGNKMFSYIQLYILRVKYGFDVYVTENVAFHLSLLFKNVSGEQNIL